MEFTTIFLILLFLLGIILAYWLGNKIGKYKTNKNWESELPNYRKDAIMKSRAVLGGQFSEQLAPYLPNFQYLPTECKFLGKPIDFIVFKGMDEKKIDEIVFVEVKSGNSKLNAHEKNLKDTINKKRIKWVEYRIPEGLTEKKDIEDKIKDFTNSKDKK
jgi:predicted Holliday junction resolvase-like endonuclease